MRWWCQTWRMGSNPIIRTIWGCSSVGRAPALQAGGRGFDYHQLHHLYSPIAQSVERMTVNHDVAGSSPAGGANIWAHSSIGRALPLQGRGHGFEFHILHQYSYLAQSVERMTVNHDVAGSSPAVGAIRFCSSVG